MKPCSICGEKTRGWKYCKACAKVQKKVLSARIWRTSDLCPEVGNNIDCPKGETCIRRKERIKKFLCPTPKQIENVKREIREHQAIGRHCITTSIKDPIVYKVSKLKGGDIK